MSCLSQLQTDELCLCWRKGGSIYCGRYGVQATPLFPPRTSLHAQATHVVSQWLVLGGTTDLQHGHWHAGYEPPQLEGAPLQGRERQAGAAENLAELGAASSAQGPHEGSPERSRDRPERRGELGTPREWSASVGTVRRFRRALSRCRDQLNKASPVVRCYISILIYSIRCIHII